MPKYNFGIVLAIYKYRLKVYKSCIWGYRKNIYKLAIAKKYKSLMRGIDGTGN